MQEKLDKTVANESRLEEDNRQQRLNVNEVQNQLTTTELLRRSQEAENHRMKMVLADKETETQVAYVVPQHLGPVSSFVKEKNLEGFSNPATSASPIRIPGRKTSCTATSLHV